MGFTHFKRIAALILLLLHPRTLLMKLKESVLIDGFQFLLMFIAKKLVIVWILIGHEFSLYIDRFSSLIG